MTDTFMCESCGVFETKCSALKEYRPRFGIALCKKCAIKEQAEEIGHHEREIRRLKIQILAHKDDINYYKKRRDALRAEISKTFSVEP